MSLRADLRPYIQMGHSIAYDGCHKIYINMDERQTGVMQRFGYGEDDSLLYPIDIVDDAIDAVMEWWDNSCSLRFVNACITKNGEDQVVTVRGQFEDEEGDDDDQ